MNVVTDLTNLPKEVKIMEVGPRDGLQNEKTVVDTPNKITFIENLVDAGITRIEVTAFVSPSWIPPLADQLEVALGIKRKKNVRYAALVPNVRGYERARSAHIDEVSIVVAASNTHNLKNLNADTKKVMERYHEVAQRAQQDACPFRAYVSCSFGCPYEGNANIPEVVALSKDLLALGAYEIALSDTIGIAWPTLTMKVLDAVMKEVPQGKIALHMHDTRGLALANIFAALSMGITSFDSAAGGLGGCPYAPGAAGNVATEDLVNMLHSMGIKTGIDIEKLCDATLQLENVLKTRVPSKIVATRRALRA